MDPKTPLELLKGVGPDRWNQRMLANVASRLAFAYPAEAEHALGLLHEPLWRQDAGLRVCRRLARTDPDRARRIAAGFPNARERAYAWTFLADGLIGTDPSGARAALGQALREIDSLPPLESPGVWSPGPAASILPLVERIAPERVTEVFWRALDQQTPGDDPRVISAATTTWSTRPCSFRVTTERLPRHSSRRLPPSPGAFPFERSTT